MNPHKIRGVDQLSGSDVIFGRDSLAETVKGDKDWTQFFHARLVGKNGQLFVEPLKIKNRIKSQANANALIKIPQGVERLEKAEQIQVQVLFS